MTRLGVDYSTSRPGAAALKAAGYTFACRYLAAGSSKTAAKALTKTEADGLRGGGVDVVSNWEIAEDAALKGRSQGVADAQAALAKHNACGGPPGRPIYFSVDFNVPDYAPSSSSPRAKLGQIAGYFDGIISVLGLARTGAYGGYWPISRLFDAGLIRWGWQAYAWSSAGSGSRPNTAVVNLRGKDYWFDTRAQLRQTQNGITVNGADCDRDEAVAADFGQWGYVPPAPPAPPTPKLSLEEDMAMIAQDAQGNHYLCIGYQSFKLDPAREKDVRYVAGQGAFTLATMATQAHPIKAEWTSDGLTRLGWSEAVFGPLVTTAPASTPVTVDAGAVAVALAANPDLLKAIAKAVNDDAAQRLDG